MRLPKKIPSFLNYGKVTGNNAIKSFHQLLSAVVDTGKVFVVEFISPLYPSETIIFILMLYLEGNMLKTLPDDFFQRLPKLSWLDLRSNKLISIPKGIGQHLNLENLLLQNNELEKLPNELGLLPNLKVLQISGNPLIYPPENIIDKGVDEICNYLRDQYVIANKIKIIPHEGRHWEHSSSSISSRSSSITSQSRRKSCKLSFETLPVVTVTPLSSKSDKQTSNNAEKILEAENMHMKAYTSSFKNDLKRQFNNKISEKSKPSITKTKNKSIRQLNTSKSLNRNGSTTSTVNEEFVSKSKEKTTDLRYSEYSCAISQKSNAEEPKITTDYDCFQSESIRSMTNADSLRVSIGDSLFNRNVYNDDLCVQKSLDTTAISEDLIDEDNMDSKHSVALSTHHNVSQQLRSEQLIPDRLSKSAEMVKYSGEEIIATVIYSDPITNMPSNSLQKDYESLEGDSFKQIHSAQPMTFEGNLYEDIRNVDSKYYYSEHQIDSDRYLQDLNPTGSLPTNANLKFGERYNDIDEISNKSSESKIAIQLYNRFSDSKLSIEHENNSISPTLYSKSSTNKPSQIKRISFSRVSIPSAQSTKISEHFVVNILNNVANRASRGNTVEAQSAQSKRISENSLVNILSVNEDSNESVKQEFFVEDSKEDFLDGIIYDKEVESLKVDDSVPLGKILNEGIDMINKIESIKLSNESQSFNDKCMKLNEIGSPSLNDKLNRKESIKSDNIESRTLNNKINENIRTPVAVDEVNSLLLASNISVVQKSETEVLENNDTNMTCKKDPWHIQIYATDVEGSSKLYTFDENDTMSSKDISIHNGYEESLTSITNRSENVPISINKVKEIITYQSGIYETDFNSSSNAGVNSSKRSLASDTIKSLPRIPGNERMGDTTLSFDSTKSKKQHKILRSPSKFSVMSQFSNPNRLFHRIEGSKPTHRIYNEQLKSLWIDELQELLNDQERIIQQEKNLKALSDWRYEKTMEPMRPLETSIQKLSKPPYDTQSEHMRILSRKDLCHQLKDMVKGHRASLHNVGHSYYKPDADKIIADIMAQLRYVENLIAENDQETNTRARLKLAEKEIELITELHNKITALRSAPDHFLN